MFFKKNKEDPLERKIRIGRNAPGYVDGDIIKGITPQDLFSSKRFKAGYEESEKARIALHNRNMANKPIYKARHLTAAAHSDELVKKINKLKIAEKITDLEQIDGNPAFTDATPILLDSITGDDSFEEKWAAAMLVLSVEPRKYIPSILGVLGHVLQNTSTLDDSEQFYVDNVIFNLCESIAKYGNKGDINLALKKLDKYDTKKKNWMVYNLLYKRLASYEKNLEPAQKTTIPSGWETPDKPMQRG